MNTKIQNDESFTVPNNMKVNRQDRNRVNG